MYNCELCEDRGFTESAYCLMSYHEHGWISRYDKTRGACTEPCECGFDPEEEEARTDVGEEELWYGDNADEWIPTQFERTTLWHGNERSTLHNRRVAQQRRIALRLQIDTLQSSRARGWVTTDRSVVGLCEETGFTGRVPAYLAGEVEEVKRGAEGLTLTVKYTFMESALHFVFVGYAADQFRFAHSWDESYTTKEVLG